MRRPAPFQAPLIVLLAAAFALVEATAASAGPALFQASFILHAFGNDITTGPSYPSNTSIFTALPVGRNCRSTRPTTWCGAPAPFYCGRSTLEQGVPALGPRPGGPSSVFSGPAGSIALPQSAFGATGTGLLPAYYPYLQSASYHTFVNAAGTFWPGGGPAAGVGVKSHTGMGQKQGSWILREGARGFGGALGLLGRLGARKKDKITGMAGTYVGTNSWNMIPALGRVQYATPTAFSAMGAATNWRNPHLRSNLYTNNLNGNQTSFDVWGTGTPWSTGSVTIYAVDVFFETVLHRTGFDRLTNSGARSIQLVTPALTHWGGPFFPPHTGHIGILKLRVVPEPSRALLLACGIAALAALRRWIGKRGP